MNSRAKGKFGELEAAKFLRSLGFAAKRGQQYHGGPDSPDIVSEDLADIHFEVKRVANLDLATEALEQALQQATREKHPHQRAVVLWRPNRKGWRLSFQRLVDSGDGLVTFTVAGDTDIRTMLRALNAGGDE